MKCKTCKTLLTEHTSYKRSGRPGTFLPYCKTCWSQYCLKQQIDKKVKAIELKGNRCLDCQKSYPYQVYDFHHREQSEKEFDWSQMRLRSWDKIVKELEKCDLLCSNCHRIRHI